MPLFRVVHTTLVHGRDKKRLVIEPGKEVELEEEEAGRIGDNVSPKTAKESDEPKAPKEPQGAAAADQDLELMTVPELTGKLEEKGVQIPKGAKKMDLVELLKATE